MSSHAEPTEHQATHARHQQILNDLIEIGADLARLLHDQVKRQVKAVPAEAPAPASTPASTPALTPALTSVPAPANNQFPEPALAFERITRAVRRTILLSQKLDQPAARNPHARRIATRKRILREVEDVIQLNAKPGDCPALQTELHDRLDSPDLEDDIDDRPLGDIIADICHDLRVALPYARNWKRRTPAEIEALRLKAAAIPPSWTKPPPAFPPEPPPRRPTKPKLPTNHEDPATIMAEFARICRDTGLNPKPQETLRRS